jgi:hypothetical protein
VPQRLLHYQAETVCALADGHTSASPAAASPPHKEVINHVAAERRPRVLASVASAARVVARADRSTDKRLAEKKFEKNFDCV